MQVGPDLRTATQRVSMKVKCEACDCEGELEIKGIMEVSDALPRRWRRRIIDHQAYILCDICGHPRQFLTGISPYLQDRLDVPENATCEVAEKSDFFGEKSRRAPSKRRPDKLF